MTGALTRSGLRPLPRRGHLVVLVDVEPVAHVAHRADELLEVAELGAQPPHVHVDRALTGEERLVAAVETGLIPITLAMEISKAETEEAQNLLLDAYETGKLRGKKLAAVRRLLEMRMQSQRRGALPSGRLGRKASSRRMTAADLMQVYQREAEKQRLLVKKSDFTQTRLLFVVEALKDLLSDDGFVNLLRAEGLATMPRALKMRVSGDEHG